MSCADRVNVPGRLLADLLPELAGSAAGDIRIGGLGIDSRALCAGDAFIALRGERHDGAAFIPAAVAAGAVVALVEANAPLPPDVGALPIEVVLVRDLAARAGELARAFYGAAAAALGVIGVTGTNGKTTCTQLMAQAFTHLGRPCGVIGTLGWGMAGNFAQTVHTTPDAVTLQRLLAGLAGKGAELAAIEVSSHALKQGRVSQVRFATAVFTNLTHDHLDYHGTFQDYGASKALLFQREELEHAVINLDDAFAPRLQGVLPSRVRAIGYGLGRHGDVRAVESRYTPQGVEAQLVTPWGRGELAMPLLGRFNLSNALAVLATLCLHGATLEQALAVFPRLQAPAGRMQRIGGNDAPLVIVDYAHTPDALEHTLRAVRQHCAGRLWCVFGCGGDRDRAKRPLMGRIAWENADELILTSDNPRSENSAAIIAEISSGIPDAAVSREADRARAIAAAIAAAAPGDCVVIAGKGHESYQETAGVRVPFDDVEHARAALAAREVRA